MKKQSRLVILSIPFFRVTKMLLGFPILGTLREHCDILVVSPFDDKAAVQSEYRADIFRFVSWRASDKIRQPWRALLGISELLRFQGYYRRFKRSGLAYYLAINHLKFKSAREDELLSPIRRAIVLIAGLIGVWPGAWRMLDRLIGRALFDFSELQAMASQYDQVSLIQSSSWGIQDRMLAWMGRKESWRTVLVPYTTDQLFCNGYLMCDFDAVCVQGSFEEKSAMEFHRVPPNRIVRLGSTWFRNIDQIVQQKDYRQNNGITRNRKVVMYVGVSNNYFPRASEYLGLEVLLSAVQSGELGDVEVIYRPLGETEEACDEIKQKWGDQPYLRVQFAQSACWRMDPKNGASVTVELREYISQLMEVDVVVLASLTSLALDAAYLGKPSVANFYDPSGTFYKRNNHLRFNSDGKIWILSAIPVVHKIEQLVPMVQQLLSDQEKARLLAHRIAEEWDFPETDFSSTLVAAVLGNRPGSGQ